MELQRVKGSERQFILLRQRVSACFSCVFSVINSFIFNKLRYNVKVLREVIDCAAQKERARDGALSEDAKRRESQPPGLPLPCPWPLPLPPALPCAVVTPEAAFPAPVTTPPLPPALVAATVVDPAIVPAPVITPRPNALPFC